MSAVPARGPTGVREKPGKQALAWAETHRSRFRQGCAHCRQAASCTSAPGGGEFKRELTWGPIFFSSSPLPRGMGSLFLFGLLGGGTFEFTQNYPMCWQLTWVPESWGRGSWVSTGVQAQRRNLTPRVEAGPTALSAQVPCGHTHCAPHPSTHTILHSFWV